MNQIGTYANPILCCVAETVDYGSLKRFEQTGEISLESLLKIAVVMNASEPFSDLFKTTEITSIQQIIDSEFD